MAADEDVALLKDDLRIARSRLNDLIRQHGIEKESAIKEQLSAEIQHEQTQIGVLKRKIRVAEADHTGSARIAELATGLGFVPETAPIAPVVGMAAAKRRERETARAARGSFAQRAGDQLAAGYETGKVVASKGMTLFWVAAALFLHLADAILGNGFARDADTSTKMFIAYMVFAVLVVLFYYKTGLTRRSGVYFGVSLFAWGFPYLQSLLRKFFPSVGNHQYLVVLMFIMPIWALYIAYNQNEVPLLHTLANLDFVLFALALVGIAIPLVGNFVPGVQGDFGNNIVGAFNRFGQDVADAWDNILLAFREGGFFSPATWRQRINETFNPQSYLYVAGVEENQEPRGVFLTNVRSLYRETPLGTDPVILGRIEAQSLLDKVVPVTTSCRLERANKPIADGKVDPEGPLDVEHRLIRDVSCEFKANPEWNPGTYYGVLGASFDFETWGYVTYTFVHRDLLLQYLRDNKNINQDLGIPAMAEPVYTNGPVMLGMLAEEQPIDINPEAANSNFIRRRFGVQLQNKWSQGELRDVYEVVILTPEEFKLDACKPWAPIESSEEGMRKYTFTKSKEYDPRLDFRQIDCQLVLDDKESMETVLAFGDKTPATFVVQTRYLYELEERVPVRIVE